MDVVLMRLRCLSLRDGVGIRLLICQKGTYLALDSLGL